ncbi:MAG TPA: hypothetical protein DEO85_00535 [Maritimibacter sp.]|nr:hypothetical protein [Maritimibacter sp.]
MDTSQIAFAAVTNAPSPPRATGWSESRLAENRARSGFADTYDASREHGGADRQGRDSDDAGEPEPIVSPAPPPKEGQRSNPTIVDAGTAAVSGQEMPPTRGPVEVTDAGVAAGTPTSGEEKSLQNVAPLDGAGLMSRLAPGTQGTEEPSPQGQAGRQGMSHVAAVRTGDGSDRVPGPAVTQRMASKADIEPGAPSPEPEMPNKTGAPETAAARRDAASGPAHDDMDIPTRGSAPTESLRERALRSATPPAEGPLKGKTDAARPTLNSRVVPSASHTGTIPNALGATMEPAAAGKDGAVRDAAPAAVPASATTQQSGPQVGSSSSDTVTPSAGADGDTIHTRSRPDPDGRSSPSESAHRSDSPNSAGVATDTGKVMPNTAALETESIPPQVSTEDAVDPVSADIAATDGSGADRTSASTMTTTALTRPDRAQSVAGQIADVVRTGGDGKIEVTLRPEELGRLSLTLSNDGRAMHVTLAADRPETLDLVRRNIDLLERELLDLGFDTLNFDFSDTPGGRPDRDPPGTMVPDPGTMAQTTNNMPPTPHMTASGQSARASSSGVDLRL